MCKASHHHSPGGQTTVPTNIAHLSPAKGQTKYCQPFPVSEICTRYQKTNPKIIHNQLRRDVAPARVIRPSITCQEKPAWNSYISRPFARANPCSLHASRPPTQQIQLALRAITRKCIPPPMNG